MTVTVRTIALTERQRPCAAGLRAGGRVECRAAHGRHSAGAGRPGPDGDRDTARHTAGDGDSGDGDTGGQRGGARVDGLPRAGPAAGPQPQLRHGTALCGGGMWRITAPDRRTVD